MKRLVIRFALVTVILAAFGQLIQFIVDQQKTPEASLTLLNLGRPKTAEATTTAFETRRRLASKCADLFPDYGLKVECMADSKPDLLITGHGVDRVFARQILQSKKLVTTFQEAGFVSVTFQDKSHTTFSGEESYTTYDIRPEAQNATVSERKAEKLE